jgi:hypothetical protein
MFLLNIDYLFHTKHLAKLFGIGDFSPEQGEAKAIVS